MIGNPENRPPTHPGEALREDYLPELGMTQTELAKRLRMSFRRVNEILRKKRRVTPQTALRLGKLFGQSPEYWLNMQAAHDLYEAAADRKEAQVLREIDTLDDVA